MALVEQCRIFFCGLRSFALCYADWKFFARFVIFCSNSSFLFPLFFSFFCFTIHLFSLKRSTGFTLSNFCRGQSWKKLNLTRQSSGSSNFHDPFFVLIQRCSGGGLNVRSCRKSCLALWDAQFFAGRKLLPLYSLRYFYERKWRKSGSPPFRLPRKWNGSRFFRTPILDFCFVGNWSAPLREGN